MKLKKNQKIMLGEKEIIVLDLLGSGGQYIWFHMIANNML